MRTWPTQFQHWMESEHPWLADVQVVRLIQYSAMATVLMFGARWFWPPGVPGAFLWVYLLFKSLPGHSDRPSTTDREATRRVFYLWVLNLLPLMPLLIPQNASDVVLRMKVPEAPAVASLIAPLLVGWLWAYAALVIRSGRGKLTHDASRVRWQLAMIWVAMPIVGLCALPAFSESAIRVFFVAHLLTFAWLMFRRTALSAGRRDLIPRQTAFTVLYLLQFFAWVDMFSYYVNNGGDMRNLEWDADRVWYFVQRFVFMTGCAGAGLAMAAVAEDVDGK
jgi:hypothetical protein